MNFAVFVHYPYKWRGDGMSVAIARAALVQYCRDGTGLIKISRIT